MISEVYRFNETEMLLFFMVLVRMTSFVVSWPVFGVENIAAHIKVLFGLILALVIFPTLHWSPAQMEAVKGDLMLMAAREAFIGLSIGYLARFFFYGFRIAGEMMSQALGLGSAQMFNPAMGGQISVVENFYVGLASLFYLCVNGHHFLITGLVHSFDMVHAAQLTLNTSQFAGIGQLTQEVVELGFKLSAPVVISILVINLVLGVVGKTVPQLNVLVTSFPVNILVGLGLMMITLPMTMDHMGAYLELSTTRVFQFVKAF
jgi:flagellar biosynthetic protein FliR